MKQIRLIIIPVVLWTVGAIPLIAPGLFSHAKMADVAAACTLTALNNPIEIIVSVISVLAFNSNATFILVATLAGSFALLIPLGFLVIDPLVSRDKPSVLAPPYLLTLAFIFIIGSIVARARYNATTHENNFGQHYPEYRYLEYESFTALSEGEITQMFEFKQSGDKPRSFSGTMLIHGGSIRLNDHSNVRTDWELRRMIEAPQEDYVQSFPYSNQRGSRRRRPLYFYFKKGRNYGKGFMYGRRHIRVFMKTSEGRTFGRLTKDPGFREWVKWYFTPDKQVYQNESNK